MSQKPDVTIRRASRQYTALLADLDARIFAQTFAADNTQEDMAAYIAASFNLAEQTAELTDPDSTFLIAEVGGLSVMQNSMPVKRRRASTALTQPKYRAHTTGLKGSSCRVRSSRISRVVDAYYGINNNFRSTRPDHLP